MFLILMFLIVVINKQIIIELTSVNSIIKENDRKQDILINGIFNSQDNKLTSTLESNVHNLVESKSGLLYVDNITLTRGVDGAKDY